MARHAFNILQLSVKLSVVLLIIVAVKCQDNFNPDEDSLETELNSSKLLLSKIKEKLNIVQNDMRHKFKRSIPKNRRTRTAFLKSPDPNRRTFSTQVLAKKMAEESLRSPKMQETFKRLTEIRSIDGPHKAVKKSVQPFPKKVNSKLGHKNITKRKIAKLSSAKHKRNTGLRNLKKRHPQKQRQRKEAKIPLVRKDCNDSDNTSGSIVSKVKDTKDNDKLKSSDESIKSSRGLLKTDVKRNDGDCTVDRPRISSPVKNSLLPVAEPHDHNFPRRTRHTYPLDKLPIHLDNRYRKQYDEFLNNLGSTENYILNPYFIPAHEKIYYKPRYDKRDPIELNSVDLFDNNYNVNYNNDYLKNFGEKSVTERSLAPTSELFLNSTDNLSLGKVNENKINRVKFKMNETFRDDGTARETKEIARQILNKIIEELEELKIDHNKSYHREELPCNLTGNWISVQAGVQLEIKPVNKHKLDVKIKKQKLIKMNRRGFLNDTWNISGQIFFGYNAPFSLTAVNCHTKSLATFIGTCKICNGNDVIQGIWSTIHEPHDCRYFPIAINNYNDIFRRIKKT